MRLDRVMVTTLEDTFLQLRLYDFGLSNDEVEEVAGNHQIIQVCELMFLLLTGKVYAGGKPRPLHDADGTAHEPAHDLAHRPDRPAQRADLDRKTAR